MGRRTDGYQELRTIFQTVDLRDQLILESTSDSRICLDVQGRNAPAGPENLVFRAARLLKKVSGVSSGVRMILRKKIPLGAGLGGGSCNAAVTLLGLNQLWRCGLELRELTILASELGSDVSFFLHGGTALGEGRGELIVPLSDYGDPIEMKLFYPGRSLSTREAYSLRDWGVWEGGKELTNYCTQNTIHRFLKFREGSHWVQLENDFEAPLLECYGFLQDAKEVLKALGCKKVMVCGSGSTLMGLGYPGRQEQLRLPAVSQDGELFICSTLSRQRYWELLRETGLKVFV